MGPFQSTGYQQRAAVPARDVRKNECGVLWYFCSGIPWEMEYTGPGACGSFQHVSASDDHRQDQKEDGSQGIFRIAGYLFIIHVSFVGDRNSYQYIQIFYLFSVLRGYSGV